MVLVDAGPLIAILQRGDNHHQQCVDTIKKIRPPLLTTWAPVTEAMYLLESARAQDALLDMLQREIVRIYTLVPDDIQVIRELMQKYADLPMDFADATLVRVAQKEAISTIFTLDQKDFSVYRGPRREALYHYPLTLR